MTAAPRREKSVLAAELTEKKTGHSWRIVASGPVLGHLHFDAVRLENGFDEAAVKLCEQGLKMRFFVAYQPQDD